MVGFLISIAGPSPETLGERLAGHGIATVRTWGTPGAGTDYLVVSAPGRDSFFRLFDSGELPLRGAREIVLEGGEEATRDALESSLPHSLHQSLITVDPVGWVDPPLEWCDRCQAFHEPDHHLR